MNIWERSDLRAGLVGFLLALGLVGLAIFFLRPASVEVAISSPTASPASVVETQVVSQTMETPTLVGEVTPTPTTAAANSPPTKTPTPTATPTITPIPEATIIFYADDTQINAGDCTNLHWNVQNAKEVYLITDGDSPEGVAGENQVRQVCPPHDTTYTLRVTKLDNSLVEEPLTIEVEGYLVQVTFTSLKIIDDTDADPQFCFQADCGAGEIWMQIGIFTDADTATCRLPQEDYWSINSGETKNINKGNCATVLVMDFEGLEIHATVLDADAFSVDDEVGSASLTLGAGFTPETVEGENYLGDELNPIIWIVFEIDVL